MNTYFEILDRIVARMEPGQQIEIDRRQVDEAFPHPPRPSKLMLELEIRLLLSSPRSKVKPRPEPPTQQEKIDKWAEFRGLLIHRDIITQNLHVKKARPLGCCGVPLKLQVRERFKPLPSPRPDRLPEIHEVCETEKFSAMVCPRCGKFEPLKA